ncbi:MAG: ABC transporter permease [Anaerolineae bacterium]|nr:ABC transporter permease [Anaerolineae bacterium]
MTHWMDVFRYEFRQFFRRKAYLFTTFGVPLIAIAIFFGYQAYQDMREGGDDKPPENPVTEQTKGTSVIGYMDLTPDGLFPGPESYEAVECSVTAADVSGLSSGLFKRLTSPYCFRERVRYYETRADGEQALDDEDITGLYVIEPDYAENSSVSLYFTKFNIQDATGSDTLLEDYLLSSLLYNVEAETYEQLYLRLRDPAVFSEHIVSAEGTAKTDNEDENMIVVYAFGLILMLSIFWGGGYLMQSVVQEKESRIIEIILSSVQPTALLLGKILAMGVLSLIQVGLYVGTFVFLGGQASSLTDSLSDITISTSSLALMGVYFVLGFLLFGSLMAVIGALSSTVRDSQNFVVLVTLPAMIPFFFLTIFVEEPNGGLATVLSIIPVTAPLSMGMRIPITDVPGGELLLSIGLLIVTVAFVIWLSGRFFRVHTLLMGTTPKLRDIPKLLRS